MNRLDCYGYNDASQLLSLKQPFNEGQGRIDAAQDKKIDKLAELISDFTLTEGQLNSAYNNYLSSRGQSIQ